MKTRAILTTIVAFLLLVAVVAAGLNTVFTVTLVETEFSTLSAQGEEDAAALKERLDRYRGKSTTFLSIEKFRAEAEAYPCLRLDSVEKKFPSTVEVKVSERSETFAVAKGETYAILDEAGVYIYDGENVNRTGGRNIELIGFGLVSEAGKPAEGELVGELFSALAVFREAFKEIRASVVSVTLDKSGISPRFRIAMRQGILIELDDPAALPAEKAHAALYDGTYGFLSRPDEELVRGVIRAYVRQDGTLGVDYNSR